MAFTWIRPQQDLDPEVEVFSPESDEAEDDTGGVLDDRYELREAIAWGGTAAIYKAFDRRLKNFVAVKVLCSGLREQIGAYFDQEGRVAAAISNPNLVRAHDRGVSDPPYIVFEFVPGQPLSQLYFERPMPWRELCEVMLSVLDALDALHHEGIVHRDVKPDNVLVQRRIGRESRVWLLDVGFAAVPPGRISNAPAPDELVFGTSGFIAPECFAGRPPDPRSDIYSVGALMYKMLTTQPVTDARELGDLLAIVPPRTLAPGAEIPEVVEDVVMRALSDIEARFQSAREMAAAIRAALAPQAVPAVVAAPIERAGKAEPSPTAGRWRAGVTLAVGAVLATLGVVAVKTGDEGSSGASESVVSLPVQPIPEPVAARSKPAGAVEPPASSSTPPVTIEPPDPIAPAAGPLPPPKSPVLTSTSPARRTQPSAPRSTPRVDTFAGVMTGVEPKVRACAQDNGVSIAPMVIKVRGASGTVESVRLLGMSSQHPFSRCVDRVIRGARPPIEGALVESFEYFRKR